MKRLTKKYDMGYDVVITDDRLDTINYYVDATNKLGKLEDIEEKLKIDLLTVYKILTDGIYEKWDENEIYYVERPQIKIGDDGLGGLMLFVCYEDECRVSGMGLNINDYGKMWAFTKEELEK